MKMTEKSCADFVAVLATKAPVPGGGGASALCGAIGTALGNMVGSLTVGKKKYASVEEEIKGKFAVKEAVFKALGHLSAEGSFDFRIVETLEDDHGCPHVTCEGPLAGILAQAGAHEVLVSITNERDLATAIALVQ